MSENEMPFCKECGAEFENNEDGSKCPKCGSKSKIFLLQASINFSFSMRLKMIGKKLGKRIFELISGYELFKKENRMVKKGRLIDKENNWYEETVIDPNTGKIIHETKEKLTDHYGHGSAKHK